MWNRGEPELLRVEPLRGNYGKPQILRVEPVCGTVWGLSF